MKVSKKGKVIGIAFAAALTAVLLPSLAFAAAGWGGALDGRAAASGEGAAAPRAAQDPCPAYRDADGDGVCDNAGVPPTAAPRAAHAPCPAYRDADGDGVCDNAGDGMRLREGAPRGCASDWGRGHGCGMRQGCPR